MSKVGDKRAADEEPAEEVTYTDEQVQALEKVNKGSFLALSVPDPT